MDEPGRTPGLSVSVPPLDLVWTYLVLLEYFGYFPRGGRGYPEKSPFCPRKDAVNSMADQLYLSLWYPNFRLAALPEALVGVMRQFALISGDNRVAVASAYPIGFTESPIYQR